MSRLPFEFLLALRYLRPKRTFVSIITLISILGVALGVAVLIIVISVMSGFDHDLREKIFGFNAHITVMRDEGTLARPAEVAATIAKNPEVRGVAPFVIGPVLVESSGNTNFAPRQDAPMLRGVDMASEGKVSELPDKIVAGKFDLSGRGLVVGSAFAWNMHLQVGDTVSIYSAHEIKKMKAAYDQNEREIIRPNTYEIRGIFDVGYYDYDARVVLASLANAQDMFDLEDDVHGVLVALKDPYLAGSVNRELQHSLGPRYTVTSWMEQNSILSAVMVEKGMMYYIMFFIVVVASFGITCTLITFVVLKTREIGIMKAIGASNRQVMVIFVIQSVVVSLLGILSGLILGLLALHFRNPFLHAMNRVTGRNLFSADVYGFGELPALIQPWDIIIICGGSLIICLLAAILPAWHASKMKTVEALRYE